MYENAAPKGDRAPPLPEGFDIDRDQLTKFGKMHHGQEPAAEPEDDFKDEEEEC